MRKLVLIFLSINILSACSLSNHTRFAQNNDVEWLSYHKNILTLIPTNPNITRVLNETIDDPCENYQHYIPDSKYPSHTPMRYVRLNFHFFQQKQAQTYGPTDARAFAKALLKEANQKLKENAPMHLPPNNNTPVLPIKYQYVLANHAQVNNAAVLDTGIYWHAADTLLGICNKKMKCYNDPTNIYNSKAFTQYGLNKGQVINVFFLAHPPDSLSSNTYKASADGVGAFDWAKIVGIYAHHKRWLKAGKKNVIQHNAQFFAPLLNHEIGHSLGLQHTWNMNDGCDDTPVNPNYWNKPNKNEVSNNVMDYNAYRNAFTPCQIGKIHARFARPDLFQRQKLIPNWCTYNAKASITIAANDVVAWNSAKDLSGDIILENNATLILNCVVNMAKGSSIRLKNGATLLINGGEINNACNEKWKGIQIPKWHNKTTKVIVCNGGSINNAIYWIGEKH